MSEGWSYLNGGLLDGKNRHFSGILAIWDVLVCEGEYLVGSTYGERHGWLEKKAAEHECGPYVVNIGGQEFTMGIKLSEHIFLTTSHPNAAIAWDFTQRMNAAGGWKGKGDGEPLVEGIVVKDQNGKLEYAMKEDNNSCWSARCRVRTGRHDY